MDGWPNFLVIGANKGGTSALAAYLAQHPSIFMSPIKEPCFFSHAVAGGAREIRFGAPGTPARTHAIPSNLAEYRQLFEGVRGETAIGEASTSYLANPAAAQAIREHLPNVRLIAVLRDPAERAFSNYLMYRMWGLEQETSFSRVIDLEERRIEAGYPQGWHYKRLGLYFDSVNTYIRTFGRSAVKIYLYRKQWVEDQRNMLADVFRFLEVDDSFEVDTRERHNVSVVANSGAVDAVLNRPNPIRSLARALLPDTVRSAIGRRMREWNRPRLREQDRARLIEFYREDILRLQDLIGRDLSHWLDPRPASPPGRTAQAIAPARAV